MFLEIITISAVYPILWVHNKIAKFTYWIGCECFLPYNCNSISSQCSIILYCNLHSYTFFNYAHVVFIYIFTFVQSDHKIKDVTYLPYFCLPSILAVNTSPWKIDLLQWHKYLEVFRLCTVLMPYCTILFVHNVSYFIA